MEVVDLLELDLIRTNKNLKYFSLLFIEIKLKNIENEHISDNLRFIKPTKRV